MIRISRKSEQSRSVVGRIGESAEKTDFSFYFLTFSFKNKDDDDDCDIGYFFSWWLLYFVQLVAFNR